MSDRIPRPLAAERAPWLRGELELPPDGLISSLALIFGALARGETVIEHLSETDEVLAIASALQALGVRLERRAERWHVMGMGVNGLLAPDRAFALGEARQALLLLAGLLSSYDFESRFSGAAGEASPAVTAEEMLLLQQLGAAVNSEGAHHPIVLRGPRLAVAPLLQLDAPRPVHKAMVLLAGLAMPGVTTVVEPQESPDHCERLLAAFGAAVRRTTDAKGRHVVELDGLPQLRAQRLAVPGDASLAGLAAVAGLIAPGSELLLRGTSVNPTRSGLLLALMQMGGDIALLEPRQSGGEAVADLRVRHSELRGIASGAGDAAVEGVDHVALAIAAAFAAGETRLCGMARLTAADRARLAAAAAGLRANGVEAELEDDRFRIHGSGTVRGGGRVPTHGDPWLAIAFLILGMGAEMEVTIDDQSAIAGLYPEFVASFEGLGASFVRYRD